MPLWILDSGFRDLSLFSCVSRGSFGFWILDFGFQDACWTNWNPEQPIQGFRNRGFERELVEAILGFWILDLTSQWTSLELA